MSARKLMHQPNTHYLSTRPPLARSQSLSLSAGLDASVYTHNRGLLNSTCIP